MIIKQNKAVKYRAYPTQTQANLIDRTIGCARKIYNLMLEDKEKHYEETGEPLSVTPAAYKKDYCYNALEKMRDCYKIPCRDVYVSTYSSYPVFVFLFLNSVWALCSKLDINSSEINFRK